MGAIIYNSPFVKTLYMVKETKMSVSAPKEHASRGACLLQMRDLQIDAVGMRVCSHTGDASE